MISILLMFIPKSGQTSGRNEQGRTGRRVGKPLLGTKSTPSQGNMETEIAGRDLNPPFQQYCSRRNCLGLVKKKEVGQSIPPGIDLPEVVEEL